MTKNDLKSHTGKKNLMIVSLLLLVVFLLAGCGGQNNVSSSQSSGRLIAQGDSVCLDISTGKMWQVGRSKTLTSLDAAKEYSSSLKEGGYDDWRLPSVTELYELYMIFDLRENGNCKLEAEGIYWSDEADFEGRVGTWELDDNCDAERQYIPKQKGKVRAIRS